MLRRSLTSSFVLLLLLYLHSQRNFLCAQKFEVCVSRPPEPSCLRDPARDIREIRFFGERKNTQLLVVRLLRAFNMCTTTFWDNMSCSTTLQLQHGFFDYFLYTYDYYNYSATRSTTSWSSYDYFSMAVCTASTQFHYIKHPNRHKSSTIIQSWYWSHLGVLAKPSLVYFCVRVFM